MNLKHIPLRILWAASIVLTLNTSTIMAQDASPNASSNLAKGQTFLKENATKPGVLTTPSGLQYKVITEGHGKSPAATDTVLVHYRGTTIDGAEFDSSYKRNEAIEFPLNRVIPCWTEGVQRMKVGGRAKLTCPPATGYGERGAGGVIPPNATLLFEVELLAINGK